jgi:putative oxidoreductase
MTRRQENRIGKWICWIGRFLLGAIFIYAALSKINSPQDFADTIAAYQVLPTAVINLLALGLPPFEFVCGLLVLSGFHIRIGALGILGMLVIFLGALFMALLRGLSIDCGCFGGHSWLDANPWVAFCRDLVLLVLAYTVYRFGQQPKLIPNSRGTER